MMSRFVSLCVLLLALKEARGNTTQVSECIHTKAALPINVYVEGCLQPPCVLHQLENAVINVVFKAPYLLSNMTTKARPILFNIPMEHEYPLEANAHTCNFFTNTYCPVLKNEVVQYTLKMFIETAFIAGISATIEFRVEDSDDQPIWCIRVPIRIARPRSKANIN